jgi:hypothetical protein
MMAVSYFMGRRSPLVLFCAGRELIDHVEKSNVPIMPHQFDKQYCWRKQSQLVEKDIDTASESEGRP